MRRKVIAACLGGLVLMLSARSLGALTVKASAGRAAATVAEGSRAGAATIGAPAEPAAVQHSTASVRPPKDTPAAPVAEVAAALAGTRPATPPVSSAVRQQASPGRAGAAAVWPLAPVLPGFAVPAVPGRQPQATPTAAAGTRPQLQAGASDIRSTATVASNTAPVTYTIQAGDTLLALAYQFGVPELALQDANGITDPQDLQIGQELSVPSVPAGEEEFAAPAVAQLAGWHLPARLNGLPLDSIVVLPAAVRQHIRQIYARGQALGRNPRAFSKVGDSTMVYPPFLAAFADPDAYQLGPYACLRPVIDQFPGSFGRASAAAKRGMHTWTEFDPAWVASDACQPGEGPLDCELRLNNPSIALIRLGANDVSDPDLYDAELRKIVDFWISNGVIPVVGSKPDRQEGSANTINHIVHIVAADKRIPLWDYDLVASTVPGKGLGPDQIHFLASYDRDYGLPAAFGAADSLEDLTGLIMLGSIEEALGNAD